MNKNIKHLILLCLVHTLVLLQEDLKAQVALGVHIGSTTNKFEGDNVAKAFLVGVKVKSTLNFGLLIDIPIKEDILLSIQPSHKVFGGRIFKSNEAYDDQLEQGILEPTVPQFIDLADIRLKYISLPILMKVISDNTKWQFMIGLEPAWNYKAIMEDLLTDEEIDISQKINNYNLSAVLGFGYRFHIKKQKFSFDVMYTQGMINVSSGYNLDTVDIPRLKTTSLESRFTWYLPFRKKNTDL